MKFRILFTDFLNVLNVGRRVEHPSLDPVEGVCRFGFAVQGPVVYEECCGARSPVDARKVRDIHGLHNTQSFFFYHVCRSRLCTDEAYQHLSVNMYGMRSKFQPCPASPTLYLSSFANMWLLKKGVQGILQLNPKSGTGMKDNHGRNSAQFSSLFVQ